MLVSFVVPAVPVAQPRQRHALIAGHVRNYTPTNHPVQFFKFAVGEAWRMVSKQHQDAWHRDAPMRLSIVAVFPRPKSKRGPNPRLPKTGKPDLGNVTKAVEDALTGLAWNDDSQVFAYMEPFEKWIAAGDEQPHVEVTIEAMASA